MGTGTWCSSSPTVEISPLGGMYTDKRMFIVDTGKDGGGVYVRLWELGATNKMHDIIYWCSVPALRKMARYPCIVQIPGSIVCTHSLRCNITTKVNLLHV